LFQNQTTSGSDRLLIQIISQHIANTLRAIQTHQPHPNQGAAIFQYIALGAAAVAIFTPMFLVTIPCLVLITAGIISLIRKEPRRLLSIATICLGLFIIIPGPSISKTDEFYINNMQIQSVNWETKRDYIYITGRVKNIGDRTVRYFKIAAYYKNASGDVIDTSYTNSGQDLHPGMAKEFKIINEASPEYKNASVVVDEVKTK
jgi:hypothetical protein